MSLVFDRFVRAMTGAPPPSAGLGSQIIGYFADLALVGANLSTGYFFPFAGGVYVLGPLAATTYGTPLPRACTISNLYAYSHSSNYNAVINLTLLKNNVAQALTVQWPIATSGLIKDTVHSVSFNAGDYGYFELVTPSNTSGTFDFDAFSALLV